MAQVANWWERPDYKGLPTQGGGRVTTRVKVLIVGEAHCTGCDTDWTASTHTEHDMAHVAAEIDASRFNTKSRALVHAKNCTAKPETT